jgi:ribonuclease HI
MRMAFVRIGGASLRQPPLSCFCQTDASFYLKRKNAFIASYIRFPDLTSVEKIDQRFGINCSTEAEWASVLFGLEKCLEGGATNISIENDNLGVIGSLIQKDTWLKREYARYYKEKICGLAKQAEWVGVRWTPRELNVADSILRRRMWNESSRET